MSKPVQSTSRGRTLARSAASSVLFGLACGPVNSSADILVLTNGATHRGEVMAETTRAVTFRYQVYGDWVTRTFERREIDLLIDEEGDQSDGTIREPDDDPPPHDSAPVPTGIDPRRPGEPDRALTVAIIPLHGQVGGTVDGSVLGTFDAAGLTACFEHAAEKGADLVVLDVHSPGGLVDEMEAICEVILDWSNRLRIVAWPDEAYSAAAIIAMSCREMVVRPDAMIGAATIVTSDGESVSALDAKFASPHYAKQRQFMERSGRPYDVVAAMTIQESRLWWSPSGGFAPTAPRESADWRELDGATTVLTMTGRDAVEWRLALGAADDVPGVLTWCGMPEDATVLDLGSRIATHNRDLERRVESLKNDITSYLGALVSLNRGMTALFDAAGQGDDSTSRQLKRDIAREIGRMRSAGTRVEQAELGILARRFEVPDRLLMRIKEDRELLSVVSRLLDSTDPSEWNEAARRLNSVLAAWRDLAPDDRRG